MPSPSMKRISLTTRLNSPEEISFMNRRRFLVLAGAAPAILVGAAPCCNDDSTEARVAHPGANSIKFFMHGFSESQRERITKAMDHVVVRFQNLDVLTNALKYAEQSSLDE